MGGSHDLEGRVEIYHDGEWGTVCNDYFDTPEAQVVCRQLGYPGGTPFTDNQFGSGTGRIWLDNLECIGNEVKLSYCNAANWGSNNCGHIEDAGVECLLNE